jgi:hypothetical protein
MGDVHILVTWIGKYNTKKVYHHYYCLRHVSHFGYSLPFHFLKDFRQVSDRRYFDPMGIGFVGG